jgi:hypothetical protein
VDALHDILMEDLHSHIPHMNSLFCIAETDAGHRLSGVSSRLRGVNRRQRICISKVDAWSPIRRELLAGYLDGAPYHVSHPVDFADLEVGGISLGAFGPRGTV